MSWGRVVVLDPELGTEIPEVRIVELLPIIRHQGPRDTKSTYYGTPNEFVYLLFCDGSQGLGFCSFGEVIHGYDDEVAYQTIFFFFALFLEGNKIS